MYQHITLKLVNSEDFSHLVTLIQDSGFRLLRLDEQELEVECYVDNFVLSLAKKYLDPVVVYHKPALLVMKDKSRNTSSLRKVLG